MAKSRTQRYVVVVFDGISLGIMSFAFGVFDLAAYYGVLPDIDVRIVSGEDSAALTGGALTGGGLACPVPYDLDAVRAADLVIIPNWRHPPEPPPHLEALRAAHAQGGVHVTQVFSFPSGDPAEFNGMDEADLAALAKLQWFMDNKISFNQLHSQQPQTIAHALADSPAGLLGWNAQLMTDDAMGERSLDDTSS